MVSRDNNAVSSRDVVIIIIKTITTSTHPTNGIPIYFYVNLK